MSEVLQVYEVPFADFPVAPAGEQNAPGVIVTLEAVGDGVGVTTGVGVGVVVGVGVTTGVGVGVTTGVGVGEG